MQLWHRRGVGTLYIQQADDDWPDANPDTTQETDPNGSTIAYVIESQGRDGRGKPTTLSGGKPLNGGHLPGGGGIGSRG